MFGVQESEIDMLENFITTDPLNLPLESHAKHERKPCVIGKVGCNEDIQLWWYRGR